jgi:c-di-AMP phosphodiesterase-like protein
LDETCGRQFNFHDYNLINWNYSSLKNIPNINLCWGFVFMLKITYFCKKQKLMKKIYLLLLLLFAFSMSGQKKTYKKPIKLEVGGVKISYDKVKHVMTIDIPEGVVLTNDYDRETSVRLNNEFVLDLVINGETITSNDDFFMVKGSQQGYWSHYYKLKPYGCKEIIRNRKWEIYNIQPGEYVLQVADVCYGKQYSNIKTGSLIIQ